MKLIRILKRRREGIDVALQNKTVFGRPKVSIIEELNKHFTGENQQRQQCESKALQEKLS
jgi:hypothetical protein